MRNIVNSWKLIHEVNTVYDYDGEVFNAPMGKILRRIVFGKGGSNIHRLILADKDLRAALKDVALTINACKKKKDKEECRKDALDKIEYLKKVVAEKGFWYNEDTFDVFFQDIGVLNK